MLVHPSARILKLIDRERGSQTQFWGLSLFSINEIIIGRLQVSFYQGLYNYFSTVA